MRTVTNQSISDGQQHCFAATETIVLGGDGNQVTNESGGQARFVAGQLVHFLPGTKVEGGGYMLAGINQRRNFYDPLAILAAKTEKEISADEPDEEGSPWHCTAQNKPAASG